MSASHGCTGSPGRYKYAGSVSYDESRHSFNASRTDCFALSTRLLKTGLNKMKRNCTSPQQGISSLAGHSALQVPQHRQLLMPEFARSRGCYIGIRITSEGLCSMPLSCSLAAGLMSERLFLSPSV